LQKETKVWRTGCAASSKAVPHLLRCDWLSRASSDETESGVTKIACPRCGERNYTSDAVCLGCGSPLTPQPASVSDGPRPPKRSSGPARDWVAFLLENKRWIGTLVALVGLVGFACLGAWKDLRVHAFFRPATGTVVAKRIDPLKYIDEGPQTSYEPVVLLSVPLRDRVVTGRATLPGTRSSPQEAEAAMAGYLIGQSYPCWYDPADPQSVVLSREVHWQSWVALAGFLAFAALLLMRDRAEWRWLTGRDAS
jgi:hypothetical protein